MDRRIAVVLVGLSAIILAGCSTVLFRRSRLVPGKGAEGAVDIEAVEKIGVYLGGGEETRSPQATEVVELTQLLLGTLPQINVPAYCYIRDEDVAEMLDQQDAAELVFSDPTDVAIGEKVDGKESGVLTDERGYRVLRIQRALFLLDGEMAAHILVLDQEDTWGCWTVETGNRIDTGWVKEVEQALKR